MATIYSHRPLVVLIVLFVCLWLFVVVVLFCFVVVVFWLFFLFFFFFLGGGVGGGGVFKLTVFTTLPMHRVLKCVYNFNTPIIMSVKSVLLYL